MTEYKFEISCPSEDDLEMVKAHYEQYCDVRRTISNAVLGHVVEEEGWLLFDDMLLNEYRRMMELLKVLEERAG